MTKITTINLAYVILQTLLFFDARDFFASSYVCFEDKAFVMKKINFEVAVLLQKCLLTMTEILNLAFLQHSHGKKRKYRV